MSPLKRAFLGLAVAGALASAAPASASVQVVFCGITPRIPCGVCVVDDTTGQRDCTDPRELLNG